MLTDLPLSLARARAGLLDHLRLPLYRNGYALLFSGAATSALGLVYWVLAARLYPAATVGVSSALLSVMVLLSGMAQLSLNNVLIRFIPVAGAQARRLVGGTYLASLAAAVVVSWAFIAGVGLWAPAMRFLGQSAAWGASFGVAIAAWGVFSLQDSALTGLRQSVWVPVENTLFALLKIVLLVLLARWLPPAGIFLSWTVPVLLSLLPVNALIFGRLLPRQNTEPGQLPDRPAGGLEGRRLVRYAGGNYLGTLSFLAYTNLLPLLVANRAGPEATAYFYLPWTISVGLQLVATNLSTSLTVEAAANQAALRGYARRVLKHSLRLLAPLVAVIVLGAPWLLRVFGASYAAQGLDVLRWLALSALPNAVVVLALGLARAQNRAGWVTLIQGSVCLLALSLSDALLPSLGIVAVGVACFASQLLVAVVLLLTLLRPLFRGDVTAQPE